MSFEVEKAAECKHALIPGKLSACVVAVVTLVGAIFGAFIFKTVFALGTSGARAATGSVRGPAKRDRTFLVNMDTG